VLVPGPGPTFNALRGSEQLDHTRLSYLLAWPLSIFLFLSLSLSLSLSLAPLVPFPSSSSSTVLLLPLPTYLPERSVCEKLTYRRRSFRVRPYEPLVPSGPPRVKGPGIS